MIHFFEHFLWRHIVRAANDEGQPAFTDLLTLVNKRAHEIQVYLSTPWLVLFLTF
jgi:hypothetical protein